MTKKEKEKKAKQKITNAKWYAAHHEEALARRRKAYAADPKRHKVYVARWQKANPQKVEAAAAAYKKANPEKVKATKVRSTAAWYAKNPGKRAELNTKWIAKNPQYLPALKARRSETKFYTLRDRAKKERLAGRPRPKACEECGRGGRICYDHNHETLVFRGWLCHKCNVILGLADDDPAILERLAAYLRRSQALRKAA